MLNYSSQIQSAADDPAQLEDLYQASRQANLEAEFRSEMDALYAQSPDNLLLAAWYHRFLRSPLAKAARHIPWGLAILLGLLAGLVMFAISDPGLLIQDNLPAILLFWSPIAALFCLLYLWLVSRKNLSRFLIPALILVLASIYVLLVSNGLVPWYADAYYKQMAIHLPLLSWICLGIALTGLRAASQDRFAFITKSIEVAVAAGLFLIFGVFLGFITVLLFNTLQVGFTDPLVRLLALGGIGLVSIISVAVLYDPNLPPAAQDFNQGLSKFVVLLMRLALPVSLLILLIYIFFIPFNFMVPFLMRDILIIFNVILFAIMGLLLGVTPLHVDDLSPRLQKYLRSGIIALAGLASLISIYALSAVVFRTSEGLTMNRTTVIGWNVINLSIFLSALILQLRCGQADWLRRLHLVINRGIAFYVLWCAVVIILIPLLFR